MVLKKDTVSKSEQAINAPAVNTLPFGHSAPLEPVANASAVTPRFFLHRFVGNKRDWNLFNRSQFMAQTSAHPTAKGDPRQEW